MVNACCWEVAEFREKAMHLLEVIMKLRPYGDICEEVRFNCSQSMLMISEASTSALDVDWESNASQVLIEIGIIMTWAVSSPENKLRRCNNYRGRSYIKTQINLSSCGRPWSAVLSNYLSRRVFVSPESLYCYHWDKKIF